MDNEIDKIQEILHKDHRERTWYACGKTFENKEELRSWGWYWNSGNKRWEYSGYDDDVSIKRFKNCYKENGLWIKTDD